MKTIGLYLQKIKYFPINRTRRYSGKEVAILSMPINGMQASFSITALSNQINGMSTFVLAVIALK